MSQIQILEALKDNGGLNIYEIAFKLNTNVNTIRVQVKKLIYKKQILRIKNDIDKRKFHYKLRR